MPLNLIFQFGLGFFLSETGEFFHESTEAEVKYLLFFNNAIHRSNKMKLFLNEPIKAIEPICSTDLKE